MKINPPKAVIDPNDPFKHALFGRKAFAESLTNLLQNVAENIVVFVNAPWGEGKTTFAQMWRANLRNLKREVIYFDAYAADYFEDPFVSFSGEILELVDKHIAKGTTLDERQKFKKTAAVVGKRLAGLGTKMVLRAVTMNLVDLSDVQELKKVGEELAGGISEVGADTVEKEIEDHIHEKDTLRNFKETLAKLAEKVRQKQGFPLTIIVDELDRCRPDFALGLLERMKHLFDVENVAFVLLVNIGQIEGYIRNVYGNADTAAYLRKFGGLFVDLPRQETVSRMAYQPGRAQYCQQLFNDYQLNELCQDFQLPTYAGLFAVHFGLTLREIEGLFTVMAIYYASASNDEFAHPFIIALLSSLKIKDPSLYRSLSAGSTSSDDFFRATRFNDIPFGLVNGCNLEWAKSFLEYCLLTDSDLTVGGRKISQEMSMWVKLAPEGRRKAIPMWCHSLDRFSVPKDGGSDG